MFFVLPFYFLCFNVYFCPYVVSHIRCNAVSGAHFFWSRCFLRVTMPQVQSGYVRELVVVDQHDPVWLKWFWLQLFVQSHLVKWLPRQNQILQLHRHQNSHCNLCDKPQRCQCLSRGNVKGYCSRLMNHYIQSLCLWGKLWWSETDCCNKSDWRRKTWTPKTMKLSPCCRK